MDKQAGGKFIVLEGIDGSGISTQANLLKSYLEAEGIRTILTKEPSDGPVGAVIRQVLSGRLSGIDDRVLALLFAADRLDHNRNLLLPALDQGAYVVCDRYLWSSYAYQGIGRSLGWLEEINQFACKPDLTILIRVQPETSMQRITAGRYNTELFEKKDTLRRVLDKYLEIFARRQALGEPVVQIDGEQGLEQVAEEIRAVVRRYLFQ